MEKFLQRKSKRGKPRIKDSDFEIRVKAQSADLQKQMDLIPDKKSVQWVKLRKRQISQEVRLRKRQKLSARQNEIDMINDVI